MLKEAQNMILNSLEDLEKEMNGERNPTRIVFFAQAITDRFSELVNASRVLFTLQNDKNFRESIVRVHEPLKILFKKLEEMTKNHRMEKSPREKSPREKTPREYSFDNILIENAKCSFSYLEGTMERTLVDSASETLIVEYLERIFMQTSKSEADIKFNSDILKLSSVVGNEKNKSSALKIVSQFKSSYPNLGNTFKQLENSIICATLKTVIDTDTYFGELLLIQKICEEIIFAAGSKQKMTTARNKISEVSSNLIDLALQVSSIEGDIEFINDAKYTQKLIEKIVVACYPVIENPKNMLNYRTLIKYIQKLLSFLKSGLKEKVDTTEMSIIRLSAKSLLATINSLVSKLNSLENDSQISSQLELFGEELMESVIVAHKDQGDMKKQELFVKNAKQALISLEKLSTQINKNFLPKIQEISNKTLVNTSLQKMRNSVVVFQRWLYEKQDEEDFHFLALLNQIDLINAYINSSILNNMISETEEMITMSREESAMKLKEIIEIFRNSCVSLPNCTEIKSLINTSKSVTEEMNKIYTFSRCLSLVTCGSKEEQQKPLELSKNLIFPVGELIKFSKNALLRSGESEHLKEKVIPEILNKINKILDSLLLLCKDGDGIPGNEHLKMIELISLMLNTGVESKGTSNNEMIRNTATKLLNSMKQLVNAVKNKQNDLPQMFENASNDTKDFLSSIYGMKNVFGEKDFNTLKEKSEIICNIVKETVSHTKYANSDLRERNEMEKQLGTLNPAIEDLFNFLKDSTTGIYEAKKAQSEISELINSMKGENLFKLKDNNHGKYNVSLLQKLALAAKKSVSDCVQIRSKEPQKLG